jgi:hypothetical protein
MTSSWWQSLFGSTKHKSSDIENKTMEKSDPSRKELLNDLLHDKNYEIKYPQTNFSETGYNDVIILDTTFLTMQQHSQRVFSQRIAEARWRYDQHWKVTSMLALTTGLMAYQKNKYTLWMALPLSTALYSWVYHYDLAYGKMINRVNQECQHIVTEEGKKKYFLSDEEVSNNAKQAVEAKRAANKN